MTIKQQGGIFGRNPTFNDVTVDGDLTVNGNTTGGDSTLSGITIEGNNNGGSWSTDSVNKITLKDLDSSVGQQRLGQIDWYTSDTTNTGVASSIYAITNNTSGISSLKFATGNSSTIDDSLSIAFDGNVTVDRGNLVIGTSGQGIDFSATSGTGTSELFDDYEEGTWTPEYGTTGVDYDSTTYSIQNGIYTKIGNVVHIQGFLRGGVTAGSATGDVTIKNLPFACINNSTFGSFSVNDAGGSGVFSGDTPHFGAFQAGQSYIRLKYTTASNGVYSNLQIADLNSSSLGNAILFGGQYITG